MAPGEPQLEQFTKSGVLTRAHPLVGEYRAHNLEDGFLVEEPIKLLVKSLARDLNNHHELGECLSAFDHRNVQISAQRLAQIIGVQPIRKTPENIRKNYLDLHGVIVNTIFCNLSLQQHVPSEWRMLLLLMKRECIGNEYLICYNVALMPLPIRILFFDLSYGHVKFSLWYTDEDKRQRILDNLPYLRDWPDRLQGNLLLEESFGHKRHNTTTPEGFFTYYRDTNGHRMDRCFRFSSIRGYTSTEFVKNLLVRYPLYLFILQEQLHKENELKAIETHTLF